MRLPVKRITAEKGVKQDFLIQRAALPRARRAFLPVRNPQKRINHADAPVATGPVLRGPVSGRRQQCQNVRVEKALAHFQASPGDTFLERPRLARRAQAGNIAHANGDFDTP